MVGLGLVVAGLLGLAGIFLYYGSDKDLPNLTKISDYRPAQQTEILDQNGEHLGTLGGGIRRRLVPLSEIPKHFLDATVAAEDPSFYQNPGIDLSGLLRAGIRNVLEGRIGPGRWGQGGSTITQQVVKSLLLTRQKFLGRKVQEIILARRLTQKLSKEEILTIYVNDINYGSGRYGCEAAAQYYFGKSISEVALDEAAFLAGVPQRPEAYNPYRHGDAAKTRQMYVLRQMVVHRYIDTATAEAIAKKSIPVRSQGEAPSNPAPEALRSVYDILAVQFGSENIPTLGAKVKTSIDLGLQKLAREAVERGLESVDERQGYRGPGRLLEGKKLAQYRYELKLARALGKGGEEAAAAKKAAQAAKRPLRFNLRPIRDSQIFEGVVLRVEREAGEDKGGRLLLDIGGRQGVVDVADEPRYRRGSEPLLSRFRPGHLVRVRLAPERGDTRADPAPLALELGPQAAMVVMDPQTRGVLALVGGYGYRAGAWDRAQRTKRQPGSSFKPFLYAAAIDSQKYTASSRINDAAIVYEDWKPENYEGAEFRGPIPLRTALADSVNTAAINLIHAVGLGPVIEIAERAGITTEIEKDVGLTLALGTNVVTPLELANAFATFAAEGKSAPYRLIEAIDEEVVPLAGEPLQAFKPETAYIVTSMMQSVVREGTAARAVGAFMDRPVAGKTGTSSGEKDAWFVGFTPNLLAVVWVGFDDYQSLGKGEAGGRTAAPIWRAFMTKALADRPAVDFTPPSGVKVVQIDLQSGKLAAPGSPGVEEVFINGTEPKDYEIGGQDSGDADKLLFQ